MVEALPANVGPNFAESEEQRVQEVDMHAFDQLQIARQSRPSLMQSESNKLPLHLCRRPDRKTMNEEEYEDSFREMLENRLYLDNVERQAFGQVVKQGVPPRLRAQFWNLCTGIHMY